MFDPKYPIFQIAYLVNDLEESSQKWHELYGAGPFFGVWHHKTDEFSYRGQPIEADVSYAFGYLGDMMLQFIVQHDDQPSIYRDMFKKGEQGFHHIGCLVENAEAERQRCRAMGFEPACDLKADGVDVTYVDTRSLNGVFTEYHPNPDYMLENFANWKKAHDTFEKGSPIFIAS